MSTPFRALAAILGALTVVGLVSGCTSSTATPAPVPSATRPSAPTPTSYPFGTNSFWRSDLDAAPIDPNSQRMVDYLVASINDRFNGIAAFNAHQYNSHLYTVSESTPKVNFSFNDCQKKGYTPSGLVGPGGQFTGVPVPVDAVPANGSDAEISFYAPATDQVWEFWKAAKDAQGAWSACWGGRLDDASKSPGYFTGGFGATATGLPNAGGLVRLDEVKAGRIDHAISISIPNPAVSANFSWPAQRSDGIDPNSAALPEGTRLRLDPSLDLDNLGLSPTALIIARAAQRYGFIVVDRSGAVSVLAEAVDKVGQSDPWDAVLGGPSYAVLKNFPWSHLQSVQHDYGRPTS